MRTWFTSDHHFGHHKIIGYCNRPFNSVGHMERTSGVPLEQRGAAG